MLKHETSANSAEQRSFDNPVRKQSWAIGFTSIFFAVLQSACTAFMAISGLRLLIEVGSLAVATTSLRFLADMHGAPIRIPLERRVDRFETQRPVAPQAVWPHSA